MKMLSLCTPREAETLVARLFARSQRCIVYASDDKAFKDDDLLNLGEIELFSSGNRQEEIRAAVRRGAFEWSVPRAAEAESALAKVLAHEDLGQREAEKASGKLHRVLDAIATICVRIGLRHPIFDPDALEMMPFRRSTTVVADTSGAIQGGLDFVARYLHPAARVKVPAIVQMEIVNFAERFFGNRRAAKVRRTDLLLDHLVSQGGSGSFSGWNYKPIPR